MGGLSDVTKITIPEGRKGVVRGFAGMGTPFFPLCGEKPSIFRENIVLWGNE